MKALTAGLIDYAGLFPPAGLGMSEAVRNFAEYFDGPDSESLGSFILPAERIDEFSEAARDFLASKKRPEPWPLSILIKDDVPRALDRAAGLSNASDLPSASVGVAAFEMPFACLAQLPAQEQKRKPIATYVEVAASDDVASMIPALRTARVSAKLRMGGITADAFPSTYHAVRFMRTCCNAGVAFKATAGLHHPVRAEYNLTYEPNATRATMYGFLNVFIAAAFLWNGADDAAVAKILEESDPGAFDFSADAVSWRGVPLSSNRLASARQSFAHSFGSCSFREPVDELKLLLSATVKK